MKFLFLLCALLSTTLSVMGIVFEIICALIQTKCSLTVVKDEITLYYVAHLIFMTWL